MSIILISLPIPDALTVNTNVNIIVPRGQSV